MGPAERAALAAQIEQMNSASEAFDALTEINSAGGLQDAGVLPESLPEWAGLLASGVPRQVYMGRLSWDTYTKTGTDNGPVYKADHQTQFHVFGKELRKLLKTFLFARRQIKDIGRRFPNAEGDPGKLPDASKGT